MLCSSLLIRESRLHVATCDSEYEIHISTWCVCVSECVRGQERKFLMLPVTLVHIGAPGSDMGKQLSELGLRVDYEMEQTMDSKHRECRCPIAVKVNAAKY